MAQERSPFRRRERRRRSNLSAMSTHESFFEVLQDQQRPYEERLTTGSVSSERIVYTTDAFRELTGRDPWTGQSIKLTKDGWKPV